MPTAPGLQYHHVIPLNVTRRHPLFRAMRASGVPIDGFTLDLPNKAAAAAASQIREVGGLDTPMSL